MNITRLTAIVLTLICLTTLIHSQQDTAAVKPKLLNINHALLDGLECVDYLELELRASQFKDSIIRQLTSDNGILRSELVKRDIELKNNKGGFWNDVLYVGLGFSIGVLTVAGILVFGK
jgi:hypothetical protein